MGFLSSGPTRVFGGEKYSWGGWYKTKREANAEAKRIRSKHRARKARVIALRGGYVVYWR